MVHCRLKHSNSKQHVAGYAMTKTKRTSIVPCCPLELGYKGDVSHLQWFSDKQNLQTSNYYTNGSHLDSDVDLQSPRTEVGGRLW